jgi:hypothetical protein
MAARSSSSTRSPRTALSSPKRSSRDEQSRPAVRGPAQEAPQASRLRGPKDKKHKSLDEVRATGRQSDQGGRPGSPVGQGRRRSGS